VTDDPFKTGAGMDALRNIQGKGKDPLLGQQIGEDRIVSLIAEGGMSRVYLAERQVGTTLRQVALKISPQSGFDTGIAERFELEQGVLASLNHPHIAQIYDAGVTDDGWPYFVMELVDGGPIDEFCETQRLDIRKRVQLMHSIVDAVAFAHSKLIVHRDIKPSNVLVAGNGAPKLLDFGIAKLLKSTDRGLTQAVPMTPRYASPEQLLNMPISTGTDIYQLGLLLYEVLTGKSLNRDTPYAEAVEKAAQQESLRLDAAAKRDLPGELAHIIEHCLRVRAAERYQDAAALRDDLDAWLNGYPVKAVGLSRRYRFGKFARRHWLPLAATAAVIVIISGALVQSNLQASRIEAARASLERVTTFQQELLVGIDPEAMGQTLTTQIRQRLGETDDATIAARRIEQFEQLAESLNFTDLARSAIDESVLANALTSIDSEFADRPDLANELRMAVGAMYYHIGMFDKAIGLTSGVVDYHRETLGDRDPTTLRLINDLGRLHYYSGAYAEAEAFYREALEGRLATTGTDDPETFHSMSDVGNVLIDLNRLKEAEDLLRGALEGQTRIYGPDHSDTATTRGNLAYVYYVLGDYAAAAPLFEKALEIDQASLGMDHPDTLIAQANLAGIYEKIGRIEDSERLHRDALTRQEALLGETHPGTLNTLHNLGGNLKLQGRFEEAADILQRAMERNTEALGSTHPNSIRFTGSYAGVLIDLGRPEEAAPLLTNALGDATSTLPPDHDTTGILYGRLGRALRLLGRYEASEAALLEGRRILIDTIGIAGARRDTYLQQLVELYDAWGREEDAAAIRQEIEVGR